MNNTINLKKKAHSSVYFGKIDYWMEESLPDLSYIKKISSLKISNCPNLKSLKGLPLVEYLTIEHCHNLETINHAFIGIQTLMIYNCFRLKEIISDEPVFISIGYINNCVNLETITNIHFCHVLDLCKTKIKKFEECEDINLSIFDCSQSSIETIENINSNKLIANNCPNLKSLKNSRFREITISHNNVISFENTPYHTLGKIDLEKVNVPEININKAEIFDLKNCNIQRLIANEIDQLYLIDSTIDKLIVLDGKTTIALGKKSKINNLITKEHFFIEEK